MLTASAIALLMAIVFVAFVTEAAVGFGATILTVTLGAHLVPIKVLLPAFVPLNILLSLWIVALHHKDIDRDYLTRRILPSVAVGMIGGMGLYRIGSPEHLLLGFGVFVVLLSAGELYKVFRFKASSAPMAAWKSIGMLGAGGIVHGMFGSGGPLIVYVAGRQLHDKGKFRVTLATLWLILNTVLVLHFLIAGDLTLTTLKTSMLLLPMLALGIAVGDQAHKRLAQHVFRVVVWLVLLVAAVILVGRHMFAD
ncbi:MAG: sulfite exporter TauE/SafE family protein [Bradymonadaceae bacterium]|nr:sulfite exporter TauE/SafE family protein [Lujinxingiaceae bacterium]